VPILLAAIEARADYLLTGDFRHFGPYFGKKIEGVTIISPAQYFKLRGGEKRNRSPMVYFSGASLARRRILRSRIAEHESSLSRSSHPSRPLKRSCASG